LLKIFHIWNTAGVAGRLAFYMDKRFFTKSTVVYSKSNDIFTLHRGGDLVDHKGRWFYLYCFIKSFGSNVIHIHGMDKIYLLLALQFYRILLGKKIIMHYHGTKVRGRWHEKKYVGWLVDKFLVSTSDLLEGSPMGTSWVPNVIDEELFDPANHKMKTNKAFHVDLFAEDVAKLYADQYGLELVVRYNRNDNALPQVEFGNLLGSFAYYVDVKRDYIKHEKILEAMSLTGLEALYSGSVVIDWKGELVSKFPDEHLSENVIPKLYRHYLRLFGWKC